MWETINHLLSVSYLSAIFSPHVLSYVSFFLDILLVYYLIYKTLLLVKGTRAEPVLKGLVIVFFVYVFSRVLNLVTLNWILGNFLGSVILVVVVLFQEDLRRGLMKVGLISGFTNDISVVIEKTIQELIAAARELSNKRIGALIVLKCDVGLEEYTEPAVHLDALISKQLLMSIFATSSPLHDGAVVVHANRVICAGAVLPLSFSHNINTNFGTRHRAALGLAERTDAIIIVVSEETGNISIFREGKYYPNLDDKKLHSLIFRYTVSHQKRRNRKYPLSWLFNGNSKGTTSQAKSSE